MLLGFRLTDRNGEPKQQLRAGYTKEAGSPAADEPEACADLDALLSWIATADEADFVQFSQCGSHPILQRELRSRLHHATTCT